jgi:hypothetical protein
LQRPTSTIFETGQNRANFYLNKARQTSSTVASLAWSDAETSTIVSKTFDTVRTVAKDRFSTISWRKTQTTQLDSHGNALGLTTLVDQPSPPANDSSTFDLTTDNAMHKEPSQSQESLDVSDLDQAKSSTDSAKVESVNSSRISEGERQSASRAPPFATSSVTLPSVLDSTDSLQEAEEYFNRPIAANDYTLSPSTTLAEASPSQSTSEISQRTPSGHWTRAMPFSSLSLNSVSPISPAWSKDPSIVRQKGCSLRPLALPSDRMHTMEPDAL